MKKIFYTFAVLGLLFFLAGGVEAASLINGAGASFPYPLYTRWAYDYNKKTGHRINYQSIGSGGGIRQAESDTVDFGASDAPLDVKALEKMGLFQFPAAIGGVVPVVNVNGIAPGKLRLTGSLLADIYAGVITKWDDNRIAALNPGLKLPSNKIRVVHRSDGSGTTWIFTNYLDKLSKSWHTRTGFGKAVKWPTGVGGKGNEGVATYVKRLKNSIGYVEFAYATQNNLTHVMLKNRAGKFVGPSIESFAASAAGADWKNTPGFKVVLTDQPGADSWPISGATFILMKKSARDCAKTKMVLDFFDWAYKNGAEMAEKLDYVPIPEKVYTLMESAWTRELKCNGKPIWK